MTMNRLALFNLLGWLSLIVYVDHKLDKINKMILETKQPRVIIQQEKKLFDNSKFETAHKRTLTEN